MRLLKKSLIAPSLALLLATNIYGANYTIETTNINEAIEKISELSKIPYIVDTNILKGKKANTFKNLENLEEALKLMFEGTGLEAVIKNNTIVIKKIAVVGSGTLLEEVSVTEESYKSGSAESGYLVSETKTLGVWGDLSIQDTPYSMSIMSSDFLENSISNTADKVTKINPVLKNTEDNSRDGGLGTQIRGFSVSSALIDGIPTPNSYYGVGTNEVDQIEVISGLSGFLYGSGNVGGVINYALKYPKATPFTKISVGNNGGENYYTSIDTSQKINDKLSVRVFGNYQGGDTAVENHEDEEKLIGVSFAYKPTDNLDLGLYYAHRESKIGTTPLWIITGKMPNANDFDTSKTYAPDWATSEVNSDKVELKANYNFSDSLRFRTAYIYKEADKEAPYFYNYLNTNTGIVNNALYWFYKETAKNDGAYAYLDGDFNTGSISHTLTFGGSFGTEKYYSGGTYANWNIPANSIDDFNNWNYTVPNQTTSTTLNRENFNTNIVLGDNITFNEQWSALIGANLASMENKNGQGVTRYDKSALTPTISLIYKPIEDLTTYVTYMEALQNGSVIDNIADTNDGKVFDPLTSKQYEIGAKYSLNQNLLLSTALFRIEKANNMTETFADNGNGKTRTTTQDGVQINEGVEILLTGKATDNLTLMGGATYINPIIEKVANKALEGKNATEVPKYQAKMYAEYRLPVEPKIYLNGGVYYTGTQWRDSVNTEKLDAYTTLDSGIRYETKLEGYDTTFRIYASNLTNEKYWAESATLSDPRSVAFNVTMKF